MLREAIGGKSPRRASAVERAPATAGGVSGVSYTADDGDPGLLFVSGATREGLDDERVVRTATAIARAGRRVFVPDLEVYNWRLDEVDIDRIRRAGTALAEPSGSVGLVGISTGGGLALLAAADPDFARHIAKITLLGAYYDLVGVLQAVTTGVCVVEGRWIPWPADERAKEIFHAFLADLVDGDDRAAVHAAERGEPAPERAGPGGAALYALANNDDPLRTEPLVEALPDHLRGMVERFSPARVAERISSPVTALHSTDDSAVPCAETLRLAKGLAHARTRTVSSFQHVDFSPGRVREWPALAADAWRVWRTLAEMLAVQEPASGTGGRR